MQRSSKAFVEEMHFERLGRVTRIRSNLTPPAARLDGHLPERVKKERRNRLMAIQQANAVCMVRAASRANVTRDLGQSR